MKRTVIQELACAIVARANCDKSGNSEWGPKWLGRIEDIAENLLPSGSGFDNGTTVDLDRSSEKRIVLSTSFHHMNDSGMYDGWTDHDIIVTPAFDGFDLRVTGRDKRDIKEYIAETFHHCLSEPIPNMAWQ